jgi:hypothetical protein
VIALLLLLTSIEVRVELRPAVAIAPLTTGFGGLAEVGLAATLSERIAVELGLTGGYQVAPYSLVPSRGAREEWTGNDHRVLTVATAGPSFRFGSLRLGVRVLAGFSHLVIAGGVSNSAQGVSGVHDVGVGAFVLGLELNAAYLFTKNFGVAVHASGHPLPASWRVAGYANVSVGVIFTL